ncbi:MAG: hypothetical protein ACMG57_01990 [Candidatus Dojkabacteria bacterium]
MAGLDSVFPEDTVFLAEAFDELLPERKMELVLNIYGKVRDMLINAKSPALQNIGWDIVEIMEDKDVPIGLTQLITLDTLESFYNFLHAINVPPLNQDQLAYDTFGHYEEELMDDNNYNPSIYPIFEIAPIPNSILEEYGNKLTQFGLILNVMINVNVIKEIQNPKQIVYHLVYAMSFLSDGLKLQKAVSDGKVYVAACRVIEFRIMQRAVAAAKTAILEMNERVGVESFAGLNPEIREQFSKVGSIDKTEDIDDLFHIIP